MLELAFTEQHLAGIVGEVLHERDGVVICRWPDLPSYWSGNTLWLKKAPSAGTLRGLLARHDVSFEDPRLMHASLRWTGEGLDEATAAEAAELGMEVERGLAMVLETAPAPGSSDVEVRPLVGNPEWDAMVALNIRSDALESAGGDPRYQHFKQGLRDHWWLWVHGGQATWWGAFVEGELVGCCGLVDTPWGGRFQSVETDPAWRRRGVCSTLVAHVAGHALSEGGHDRLHLSAEPEGPARRLYEGLGFVEDGSEWVLTKRYDPAL